jgi:protein-disulfide isomerase
MSELVMPVGVRDHAQGSAYAPVTLLEYGDYECPYCGQAYVIVKRLQAELGDELRFVFRNFPLAQVHPHALRAALAAEAAGFQGAFWPMHDVLFEHQGALDTDHLVTYAALLELDVERFIHDTESGKAERRVREDFMSGVRSGVNGTPTFFVNDHRHDQWYQYGALREAVYAAAGVMRS